MAKSKPTKSKSAARDIDQVVTRLSKADATSSDDAGSSGGDIRVRLVEREGAAHPLLIYSTAKGINVDLAFHGGSLWATQDQMADMFGVNIPSISRHLKNIFEEGELDPTATVSEIERVADEGNRKVRRRIETYNINAIISVGYRVGSMQGTMFRIWATDRLVQILTKAMDDLKQQGVRLLGLDGDAPNAIEAETFSGPVALVLGAEGKGMRDLTGQTCDALVRISTADALASLNVSNAAAVALHAIHTARLTRSR